MLIRLSKFGLWLLLPVMALVPNFLVRAQSPERSLVVRSDIQEANSQTGVVTARGNVQIDYPARQIRATAAQAQYFSRERRIVLSGNVYVLQNGNSLRGETITYLIDEGRFVALPRSERQVESIYLVNDPEAPTTPVAPANPTPFNPKPEFKGPTSD
jgi:lipopolysaccharide export system protein LptA